MQRFIWQEYRTGATKSSFQGPYPLGDSQEG